MSGHSFDKQAATYRKFRPTYPEALYDFLAGLCPKREIAWDVGTGNGQAAAPLAKRFEKVVATDVAEGQISEATPIPGVTFLVCPAEKAPVERADLVTVAQAVHWFDLDRFYAEVKRVLGPDGVIAVWGYGFIRTEEPLNALLDHYGRNTLGPYWSEKVRDLQDGYRKLPFPFTEIETPRFIMTQDWNYSQLRGYFDSWSAAQIYKDSHGGRDPFELVRREVETAWQSPEKTYRFEWSLSLKVGRA
jgi:SAM-dependent methyltransferase